MKIRSERLRAATLAAVIHLAISALIAAVAAIVVLGVWFPYPYRILSGGMHLFLLMIGIDVICGPLLTLIIFNPKKSKKELFIDLGLIGLLQCIALLYGMHSIAMARPVALVFEVDRFVSVTAAQIRQAGEDKQTSEYNKLSWTGPRLLSARSAANGEEAIKSIELSLHGIGPSARTEMWQSYENNKKNIILRKKNISSLLEKIAIEEKNNLLLLIDKLKLNINDVFYLPMVSEKELDSWIVLLDGDANIIGYAPLDGFL